MAIKFSKVIYFSQLLKTKFQKLLFFFYFCTSIPFTTFRMMIIVEVSKFLFPCIAVVLIAYWLIHRPIRLEKLKIDAATDSANYKVVTPIKLAAYERLVLFLERTSPDEILNRELDVKMSSFEFQMRLLKVVRDEFEHNVAQQIYLNNKEWQAVVDAKNDILQLINMCATQVNANDKAIVLAQTILRTYNEAAQTPTKNAIALLKNEVSRLIN